MIAIGAAGVAVVMTNHCNRDQPYLDPVRVKYDPTKPNVVKPPQRAKRGAGDLESSD